MYMFVNWLVHTILKANWKSRNKICKKNTLIFTLGKERYDNKSSNSKILILRVELIHIHKFFERRNISLVTPNGTNLLRDIEHYRVSAHTLLLGSRAIFAK
jgi:hypothetical protein